MAKREKPKGLTTYQQIDNQQGPREIWCGQRHLSTEQAIVHVETNLEMRGKPEEPSWGTMRFTNSVVVGWQVKDRKRYRLDYAHAFVEETEKAAKWADQATQGIPGRVTSTKRTSTTRSAKMGAGCAIRPKYRCNGLRPAGTSDPPVSPALRVAT
jgi:hypothetical protein